MQIIRKDAYAGDLKITASPGVLVKASDIQNDGDEDTFETTFQSAEKLLPNEWTFSIHYFNWRGVPLQRDYAVAYHPEASSSLENIVVKPLLKQ